jgi:ornithine decarboxylase
MKLKENTVFTGKYFVFGMDAKVVNDKIMELRNNKNIDKIGIHFHRKTQNVAEWQLKEELLDALKPEVFDKIDIINIGGGIPAKYKNSNDKAIEVIYDSIRELNSWLKDKNIELWTEPGRAIAAPAVVLEANILNIYDNNIIVDCSIFNGMLDTAVANVKLIVENELDKGNSQQNYTIKGITPASEDILRYSVYLDNPKIGDKIRFLNAGAYTYATDFCDLDKIGTVIVE